MGISYNLNNNEFRDIMLYANPFFYTDCYASSL